MADATLSTGGGGLVQEDERAEWIRPALHHLKVSNADNKQKKSEDGVQGKGILS